jgi:pimeloyl-ACP methyl ester carboxylesterase
MGGAIILQVALQHPSAVKGLILLSTGARLRVTSAILDKVLSDYDGVVNFVTKFAWSQNASPDIVSLGRRMLHRAKPESVHGDYVACNNYDLTNRLSEIDVPTLIIGGADDKMTPIAYSQYLAEHIIGANLVSLNGGGHMLAQEQPEPVALAVLEFLARMDGSKD